MNKNENLLDLIALLYKWRIRILGATFIAALITAGVSLLLDNYYAASTLFYAASPDLAKPMPLGINQNENDIYGSDTDVDRLFSIAKSNEVIGYLIEEFDLYTHYDIDPKGKKAKHKLLMKLEDYYTTTKTKYDAINLSFEDSDPEFASRVANSARDKIDEIAQNLIKQSQGKLISSYKANITIKQKNFNLLTDSLFNLRKRFKIFNTQSQGEAFGSNLVNIDGKLQNTIAQVSVLKKMNGPRDSILILESKVAGFKRQLESLKSDISSYNDGYPSVITVERDIKSFGEQLSIDKERLAQLESVFNSDINAIHIVEKAEVPVIKSWPKRSIIVIGVAFLTFVLMSLWVLLQDQFNKNSWREKFKDA